MLNLSLAGFFLLFLVPIATHLARRPTSTQVLLVLAALPFLLLTVLCLCSAIRPGSLGRLARAARDRRASRHEG